jgi:hypothetical protein
MIFSYFRRGSGIFMGEQGMFRHGTKSLYSEYRTASCSFLALLASVSTFCFLPAAMYVLINKDIFRSGATLNIDATVALGLETEDRLLKLAMVIGVFDGSSS